MMLCIGEKRHLLTEDLYGKNADDLMVEYPWSHSQRTELYTLHDHANLAGLLDEYKMWARENSVDCIGFLDGDRPITELILYFTSEEELLLFKLTV
jgi:hypothetical protein